MHSLKAMLSAGVIGAVAMMAPPVFAQAAAPAAAAPQAVPAGPPYSPVSALGAGLGAGLAFFAGLETPMLIIRKPSPLRSDT